jgi:phosphate transport system protein
MRTIFDSKIHELEDSIIKMGAKVEKIVDTSFRALFERNDELAERAIEMDKKIDELEIVIEKKCINLIALQQPLAKDLREIAAILKIITDLERIGDLAVNIARMSLKYSKEEFIKPLIDLPKMESLIRQMIRESLDSFVNRDPELARKVAIMDDQVDEYYEKIYTELLEILATRHEIKREKIVELLFVGRYLERMADHVTNICERVVFMTEGKREYY